MENPSEEDHEMAIPLNSTYGQHGHLIHHPHNPAPSHNHIIVVPSSGGGDGGPRDVADVSLKKSTVRYRECLKNHAAAMGGNATDGCGEFMPSGEEGTLEALTCSACNCHRNFHRKETDGEFTRKQQLFHLDYHRHHHAAAVRAVAPHPMIMQPYNMGGGSDQSDEGGAAARAVLKKRFRTKFTAEQKEKMLNFAEKVGWKIQKQEEGVVQQFCQEVGVKRRVLKVWMHNNKHNLAKKNLQSHDHTQDQL